MGDPSPEILREIHRLKRDLTFVRKSTWPLREIVGELERRARAESLMPVQRPREP